jgi:DNA invertase Pin-like site-specific DNA recombinase
MKKPKKNKLKAERRVVGYVRVSTRQQVAVGESIDIQIARIQEWAKLNDYELIGIELDVGSARHEGGVHEREGLQSLIRTANREKVAVVVTSWDRLSRSEEGIDRILKQLPGRRLFALDDEQNRHYHSYGQKRSVILDRVRAAENEAVATASATRQALERKKASGMKLGSPLAGSQNLRSANVERSAQMKEIARVLQSDPGYDEARFSSCGVSESAISQCRADLARRCPCRRNCARAAI